MGSKAVAHKPRIPSLYRCNPDQTALIMLKLLPKRFRRRMLSYRSTWKGLANRSLSFRPVRKKWFRPFLRQTEANMRLSAGLLRLPRTRDTNTQSRTQSRPGISSSSLLKMVKRRLKPLNTIQMLQSLYLTTSTAMTLYTRLTQPQELKR